jgi:ABC-2 type transport system permease protein
MTPTPTSRARLAILTRHELRRAWRSRIPRLIFAIMPIGLVAFLRPTFDLALSITGSAGTGSSQAVPGIAVMFAFIVLVFFGYSAFDDFGLGMWDRLRVSRVRGLETMAAKATAMYVHLVVHLGLVFVIGWALLGFHVTGSVAALTIVLLATSLMLVCYAFMAFALSTSNALYNVFCYVGALVLSALGGGLFPFSILPGWARSIAPATPLYWCLQACRGIVLGTYSGGEIARHLAAIAGFALLFALLGAWRFDPSADREAFDIG